MTTETAERTVVDGVEKRLFIGGEWRDASGGATLAVEDPSTAEPLAEVADATPDDALAALGAARSCGAPSRRSWRGPTSSPCS
jgi:succinate-semialdehyde dehydrogenase / glutarate-semialdehyde dehydrogenase